MEVSVVVDIGLSLVVLEHEVTAAVVGEVCVLEQSFCLTLVSAADVIGDTSLSVSLKTV